MQDFSEVNSQQQLQSKNPLFQALTRPPMCFGVPQGLLISIFVVHLLAFAATGSILTAVSFGGSFVVARLYAAIEPNIANLLLGALQQRAHCRNRAYWGCNSYSQS